MTLLRLSDLKLGYGSGPSVVTDAHLELGEGETVAIVGPSGGGKTTLLKAIAGLLPPRAGALEIAGVRWPHAPPRGTVGYVPQRLGLVRHATTLENACNGGLHETGFLQSLFHRTPPAVEARARSALERLGLAEKVDDPVHALSGGQQRRVAVARAIVQRPRLLLADEFLGELDPATANAVVTSVEELQRETGMGIVVVEHHLDQALDLADRVFRMKAGRLMTIEEVT